MTTTLEHKAPVIKHEGGGLARHQNFLTGLIGGVAGAFIAWAISHHLLAQDVRTTSDAVAVLTGCGWIVGFWLGIGALNAPFAWLIGKDQTRKDQLYYAGEDQGTKRYWKYCTETPEPEIQVILRLGWFLHVLWTP